MPRAQPLLPFSYSNPAPSLEFKAETQFFELSFHLAMDGVVPAGPAKLLEFQPGRRLFLVFGSRVIPVLAVGTL